jgi:hypothetical protein
MIRKERKSTDLVPKKKVAPLLKFLPLHYIRYHKGEIEMKQQKMKKKGFIKIKINTTNNSNIKIYVLNDDKKLNLIIKILCLTMLLSGEWMGDAGLRNLRPHSLSPLPPPFFLPCPQPPGGEDMEGGGGGDVER